MESLRAAINTVQQPVSGLICSYAELTAFFAGLVKRGVITRALLKRLLYRQCADEVTVLGVCVRRSHRVECVLFPTKLTFSAVEACGRERTFSRQDAVDHSSSEGSCSSNPFGYIHYFAADEEEDMSKCKPNFLNMSDSKSQGSSFDVPPQPVTLRGYEDLSALGHSQDNTKSEPTERKTLPLVIPSTFKEMDRSVSVDPKLCSDLSPSEEEVNRTFYSHFALPCEVGFADADSLRSSDSGLADVARTVSECDCTVHSLCSTPRTSAQPALPAATFSSTVQCSKNSTICFTSHAQLPKRSAESCTVVNTVCATDRQRGIYRSGIYAHWWAKAQIPPTLVFPRAGKHT